MSGTSISRRCAINLISAAAVAPFTGAALAAEVEQAASNAPARAQFHLTPEAGWINDPQRPIFLNGVWNLWVLFNGDYPVGRGTSWRHYTSEDLVRWIDRGVSIPKNTTPYGDVWTGSTVVDTYDTAGFGAGALIALVTMPCKGTFAGSPGQNQSTGRWYSTNGGRTFSFDSIVQPNVPGGSTVFRDPNIFWHTPTQRWIMSLAEVNKLSVYTSPDLRDWTYESALVTDQLGILECPNLFPLHLYDASARVIADKWILLAGANGHMQGRTIGTHYWVGTFDGIRFKPDAEAGAWLDFGSDFYACTVFTPASTGDRLASAHAIAWMSNWAYATHVPTHGYLGQLSTTRTLRLQSVGDKAVLFNAPVPALDVVFSSRKRGKDQVIDDHRPYVFPASVNSPVCRMDFTITRVRNMWPENVLFSVRAGSGYSTQIVFDFHHHTLSVQRGHSGPQFTEDKNWTNTADAPFAYADASLVVSVLIDVNSVEVFVNHGQVAMTNLITAPLSATGVTLSVVGGSALLSDFSFHSASS